MEVGEAGSRVYGRNGIELGRVDDQGLVWWHGTVAFKFVHNSVYSAHDQYLGKLIGGIGVTDLGQFILAVEGIRSPN
jgi:hypothetical protein